MLSFDEFITAAKQVEHVTDCTLKTVPYGVQIEVEAYMANEDGSCVESGFGAFEMTVEQLSSSRWTTPGPWLLQAFERAMKAKYRGFVRYATADEIAAHKSAKETE